MLARKVFKILDHKSERSDYFQHSKGDSGGPLTYKNDGNLQVVGLASWGYGCGFAWYPGVYTNVAFYRDWIDANANQNGLMNC